MARRGELSAKVCSAAERSGYRLSVDMVEDAIVITPSGCAAECNGYRLSGFCCRTQWLSDLWDVLQNAMAVAFLCSAAERNGYRLSVGLLQNGMVIASLDSAAEWNGYSAHVSVCCTFLLMHFEAGTRFILLSL